MLPSIRHFLKFIDCYDKFDKHGFIHKVRFHHWRRGKSFLKGQYSRSSFVLEWCRF